MSSLTEDLEKLLAKYEKRKGYLGAHLTLPYHSMLWEMELTAIKQA